MPISDAMTQALATVKTAHEAALAQAVADATGPAVAAKDAEDVAAVNDFAAQIAPAPTPPSEG